jgi:hypothetical protein
VDRDSGLFSVRLVQTLVRDVAVADPIDLRCFDLHDSSRGNTSCKALACSDDFVPIE